MYTNRNERGCVLSGDGNSSAGKRTPADRNPASTRCRPEAGFEAAEERLSQSSAGVLRADRDTPSWDRRRTGSNSTSSGILECPVGRGIREGSTPPLPSNHTDFIWIVCSQNILSKLCSYVPQSVAASMMVHYLSLFSPIPLIVLVKLLSAVGDHCRPSDSSISIRHISSVQSRYRILSVPKGAPRNHFLVVNIYCPRQVSKESQNN